MSGPLAGRRVVVTRAAEQADELAERLRRLGAQPVLIPLIETVDPLDGGVALRRAIDDLGSDDWLVVTSPNGARRLAGCAAAIGASRANVAAIGVSTADILRVFLGADAVDLVPPQQDTPGLVDAFPRHSGRGRVVIATADAAGPDLAAGLAALGWPVTTVVAYRTLSRRPSGGELLQGLAADAVLFASGSAVRAWVQAFGVSTPPVVVAIGPSTAAIAAEIGLKVDAVATDHSLGGLIGCLLTQLGDPD